MNGMKDKGPSGDVLKTEKESENGTRKRKSRNSNDGVRAGTKRGILS